MASGETPAASGKLRRELVALFAQTEELSPEVRAAVAAERVAANLRRARLLLPVLLLVHLGCMLFFWPEGSGGERMWREGIARVHGIMVLVTCVLLAAVYAPLGVGWARGAQQRLGGLMLIAWGAVGTAISFNSHHVRFTLIPFAISAFMLAATTRTAMRPTAIAFGVATLALVAGVIGVEPPSAIRDGLIGNTIVIALVAFMVSRVIDVGMVREVAARLEIEGLNRDLERRVGEQVAEIVARAREIEKLNTLLDAQVRERSRELAAALGRLAAAELGETLVVPGTLIGDRVEIERPLGVGGMGVVYAGRDRLSGQAVAVKLIQTERRDLDVFYRFLTEARAAASVSHPGIVRVLHVDVAEPGWLYQVLELVDGETLEERLDREGALPPAEALRMAEVVAEALDAAHRAGVVHRDVKPSNIMLTAAEPGAKLFDFGLAKLRDEVDPRRTAHGDIIGTPAFLAPEQVTSPQAVAGSADVYALGCTLYLCLAGAPPFAASTPEQWLHAHVKERAADLASRVPGLPPSVAALVARCLDKDPAARPSAAEVAAELRAIGDAAGMPRLIELEHERERSLHEGVVHPGPARLPLRDRVAGRTGHDRGRPEGGGRPDGGDGGAASEMEAGDASPVAGDGRATLLVRGSGRPAPAQIR